MRFGCCIPFSGSEEDLARIESLREIGYQYIEPPVGCLKIEADPEEYYAMRRTFNRAALAPEAFNCFIPGDLRLVGDEVDWARVEKYAALALERVEEVGATTVVFGSGAARCVPEGYPEDEARAQLRYFLSMTADYGGGLTIAVESLSGSAGDPLRFLSQAAELVREVGRAEVRLVADSLHMDAVGETWQSISEAAELVVHAHCCDRDHLVPGAGEADLAGFFEALRVAQYDGRMSVECALPDFEDDARAALEYLQDLAQRK